MSALPIEQNADDAQRAVDFEVTITLVAVPDDVTPEDRRTIEATMNHARDAALAVLAAAPEPAPLPASLAAAIATTIRAHDELTRLGQHAISSPHYGRDMAVVEAIETFNAAFTNLKTCFEKEFPHGSK